MSESLRERFPAVQRVAFLNAGTDGPVPTRAVAAVRAELGRQAEGGRTRTHFEHRLELQRRQREAYAALLGCDPGEVALTTSTSEGLIRVFAGLRLKRSDQILTSDEEHPGLLGPLQVARDLFGARVRAVPLAKIADAVGPRTRLVACSHVSWVSGSLAPKELAQVGVPVLLDGAQGVGAVPVDVRALGCDAYAASGQKWLCGPDATGMLYVSPDLQRRLAVPARHYNVFADPGAGLNAGLHEDARRFDTPSLAAESSAFALASLEVLEEAGWDQVHARGRDGARRLADALSARGVDVTPRDETTLVAWSCQDPADVRDRLAERGVIVRDLPGRGLLRASVGAWNDGDDLNRLLEGLEVR